MGGVTGAFSKPQQEIMSLRAVVAIAEAAGGADGATPCHDELADVVVGTQPLWREVGFVRRHHVDPVVVDEIVVAVADVDVSG